MEKFYTTEKLPGHRRVELWRQFISETFVELECRGMSRDDFFGELRPRAVGGLGISAITTDAYDVFRTSSGISGSSTDDFIVSVQTEGSSTIRQLDREVTLNPGDFTFYDASMPYHLHFESRLSQLVVKIPRDKLRQYIDSPETLTALPIKGSCGISQITAQFAQIVFEQGSELDEKNQARVADTLASLLGTSILEATAQLERAPRNRATQLLRIKRFISLHLQNPDLSVQAIAASHGITERYVQILFEPEGITPGRYIWNERLKAAEIDLVNPLLGHRSISEICFAWGFKDTAHFSRAFKTRYASSPREYRRRSREELGA